MTRKWSEVNDLSGGQYSANENIRFQTAMQRSDLCDYSDAFIVVKGRITVDGTIEVIEIKFVKFEKVCEIITEMK